MRTRQLRVALRAFAEEAAWRLAADTAEGAEVPFEVAAHGRRDAPLYCYRPLVGAFVAQRAGVLAALPSYLPAAHQLAACGGLEAYLRERGEPATGTPRARADAALLALLGRVFGESTEFVVHEGRLEAELDDLERLLTDGRAETVVVAPVLGLSSTARSSPSATACPSSGATRASRTSPRRRAGRRAPPSRTSWPSCAGRPRPATPRPWRTPACAWRAC